MSEILILPLLRSSLVFGLDWFPLISGPAGRAAYRCARQYRATHMVVAGESAAAVGVAALKLNRKERRQALNSAAQNVAQLYPVGTVALLLELGQSSHWLVAVHEGAVVARTDQLYGSELDAQEALGQLRRAYPKIDILGAPSTSPKPDLAAIDAASDGSTRLSPASRWHSFLPAPVQWFVLALLLILLVPQIWRVAGSANSLKTQSVDPMAAWREAVGKQTGNVMLHGVRGTELLLDSFYQLPVNIAGWSLAQAACVPQGRQWQCRARYDRRDHGASNEHLLAKAPAGWQIEFTSIDQAAPFWTLPSAGIPLTVDTVSSSAENERRLFSALQGIRAAFTKIQWGKAQALKVVPPRDETGRAIPRPPGLPGYMTRSMQFSGPLRSSRLLLPHTGSIAWEKISFSLHDAQQPDLTNSRISVSFQGVLYEIEPVVPLAS